MGRKAAEPKSISRIPQVPYRIVWHCPRCEDGKMVVQSGITTGLETQWKHQCDVCGHEAWDAEQHPRLDYEDYEPPDDPDNRPY